MQTGVKSEAVTLSIIIPAYNENRRIGSTVEKALAFLNTKSFTSELIVVDDGSTDNTAEIVRRWARKDSKVCLEMVHHAGKGWAVRRGMLKASGYYRMLCDADLAMPVEHVDRFIGVMEQGYDIVIGSRQITGARRSGESMGRHFRGRVFNWFVRMLAVKNIQDTQCGFKCFRGDIAERLFKLQKTDGWGFDVEILYLAQKKRITIFELPIEWYHQSHSKLRQIDALTMLRDILLVRLRSLAGLYAEGPDYAGRSDTKKSR